MTIMEILLTFDDPSDFDYLRTKVVAAIENLIDEEERRLDGDVTVEWDTADPDDEGEDE